MTRTVAAFDFDGTLTTRDTFVPFLVAARGWRRVATVAAPRIGGLLRSRHDDSERDRTKAAILHALFRDQALDVVNRIAELHAARIAQRWLRNDVLARLEWHRSQDHEIVIVSASLRNYIDPIAQQLGIQQVFATTLATDPITGRYTGALVGNNVRGAEKATLLRSFVNGDDATVWAYGDSAGDRALLAAADHPTWVTEAPLSAAP
jgi:phosphatidylglycerophosphatase C